MSTGKKMATRVMFIALLSALALGCSQEKKSVAASKETEKAKTGVVLIVNGNIGDKSFNDLAYAGLKKAEAELGIRAKLVENSYDSTKYETTLIEFSEDPAYQILVLNSYDVKEIVEKIAPKYPNKNYILYDADLDFTKANLSNAYSMNFKQNEGSFVAGALAAKLTTSGISRTNPEKVIGYIAGGENTIINDFLIGYIEGSEYANPEVKMLISYIGDFKNAAKGKEMALAQYMQKADIIFQVAAGAGMGVLEAAKEKNLFALGVDNDQQSLFVETDKDQANAIVSSMIKKVDETVFNCIRRAVDKTLPWGKHEDWGLKEGAVGVAKNAYYKQVVPQDIQKFVDETEAKVVSGQIVVSTNIGKPTEFITNARNRIKPGK